MSKFSYRSDIDGIRAVAVSSVVAYHVSTQSLPGGYLGVDIFFVLSGFLITTIIWTEITEGRFSLARFYERRIRRIMPALLLVLAVTSVGASAILLPVDLVGFAKSLLSTIAFIANVYFWRDTNYFARESENKPLLHMWSLGVEEQFYLFFPLILFVVARYWRGGARPTVMLLTLASLGLDIAMRRSGGENPAFFLFPTRAWELGVGALLAMRAPAGSVAPKAAAAAAWIGAALVVYALVLQVPLPGNLPMAVPAVVGTALLVWAGTDGSPNRVGALLSSRPLVRVGLISYSLYLWHWPVLVLSRYYLVRDLEPAEIAAALVVMVVLAHLSWRYVERPFRDRSWPYGKVLVRVGAGTVVVSGVAAVLLTTQGLPSRLPALAASINAAVGTNYRCPIQNYLVFGASRACLITPGARRPADMDLVLFGNSHAQMYAPLVASIAVAEKRNALLVPMNGCLPTPAANLSQGCAEAARSNLDEILKLSAVRTVVLGTTWDHTDKGLWEASTGQVEPTGTVALIRALDQLIDEIEASGRSVVLIGPIPRPGWDVASVASRELAFGRPPSHASSIPQADFSGVFAAAIAHFEARLGGRFVRPDRAVCFDGACRFIIDGRSVFADSNHIAEAELPRFRADFERALGAGPDRPPVR